MKSLFSSPSFEMELTLSPAAAFERIIERTDDLHPSTDREAWLGFVHRFRGEGDYMRLRDRDSMLLQRRVYLFRPHHGVRVTTEAAPFGCKLRGRMVLVPRTKGMFFLWFGTIGIVFLFQLFGLVRAFAAGNPIKVRLLEMLFPVGLLLLGMIALAITKRLAENTVPELELWLTSPFDHELTVRQ